MLTNALLAGVLPLLLAASPTAGPCPAAVSVASQPAPAGAWDPTEGDERRAGRLIDEFLAPLAGAGPDQTEAAELRRLAAQLGDADWHRREAVSAELVRRGMVAAGALREACRDCDPEVAFRARQALEDIPEDGLRRVLRGFETDANRAGPSRQSRIVAELAALEPAANAALARIVAREGGVAGDAERYAREAEAAQDDAGAEGYAFSARVAAARLQALAVLSGELAREIADLNYRREEYRRLAAERRDEGTAMAEAVARR